MITTEMRISTANGITMQLPNTRFTSNEFTAIFTCEINEIEKSIFQYIEAIEFLQNNLPLRYSYAACASDHFDTEHVPLVDTFMRVFDHDDGVYIDIKSDLSHLTPEYLFVEGLKAYENGWDATSNPYIGMHAEFAKNWMKGFDSHPKDKDEKPKAKPVPTVSNVYSKDHSKIFTDTIGNLIGWNRLTKLNNAIENALKDAVSTGGVCNALVSCESLNHIFWDDVMSYETMVTAIREYIEIYLNNLNCTIPRNFGIEIVHLYGTESNCISLFRSAIDAKGDLNV